MYGISDLGKEAPESPPCLPPQEGTGRMLSMNLEAGHQQRLELAGTLTLHLPTSRAGSWRMLSVRYLLRANQSKTHISFLLVWSEFWSHGHWPHLLLKAQEWPCLWQFVGGVHWEGRIFWAGGWRLSALCLPQNDPLSSHLDLKRGRGESHSTGFVRIFPFRTLAVKCLAHPGESPNSKRWGFGFLFCLWAAHALPSGAGKYGACGWRWKSLLGIFGDSRLFPCGHTRVPVLLSRRFRKALLSQSSGIDNCQ